MTGENKWTSDLSEKDVVFKYKGEDITVRVKPLTWSLKNKIVSKSIIYSREKNNKRMNFDLDFYNKECLINMITKAPWGNTTYIFLSQIDEELGNNLQKLIPGAFLSEEENKELDFLAETPDES